MALLVVMYKTPHDAAAFDKHYFEKHIPLPKKIPGLRKMRSQPQAPWRRLRDRPTITWWHSCTTTTSRLFKAFASAEGQAAVADVQTFATGGADIFMFDTHARCDSPSRNQNTGAEAAPVFSYSRPPVGRGDP